MKRIAIAILGIAVVSAIAAATAAGEGTKGRVIELVELTDGATFGAVDNAPTGVSIGDSVAFSKVVAERRGKRVVGRIDVTCVTTSGSTAADAHQACHGVLTLRDGQIALETAIVGVPKSARVAVTGGTDAYAGASGVMISNVQDDGSELVTLKLLR
jgi:hypothetical protein